MTGICLFFYPYLQFLFAVLDDEERLLRVYKLVLEFGHLLLERCDLRFFADDPDVPLDDALIDGLVVVRAGRRVAAFVARR